ncbi:MAG TPA: hypothetical protein VKG45_06685 [Actinomycetes bacterium]|nr:hypothetical protein [Actinomycetes bacterium]
MLAGDSDVTEVLASSPEEPVEQPAPVAATADGDHGGDLLAGGPAAGWQLTLVESPRDWTGDAVGDEAAKVLAQPGQDADPADITAGPPDPARQEGREGQEIQLEAGQGCRAAGGCPDGPEAPGGLTKAAGITGGGPSSGGRPPGTPPWLPPRQQPDPRLGPQELAQRELEQQALERRWAAERAAAQQRIRTQVAERPAPGVTEQALLEEAERQLQLRMARQQRMLDADWARRVQAAATAQAQAGRRGAPQAADFQARVAGVRDLWLQQEVIDYVRLNDTAVARQTGMTPRQANQALNYLRAYQRVLDAWLVREVDGNEQLIVDRRFAFELNVDHASASRIIRDLRRSGPPEGWHPMVVVDLDTQPPGTSATDLEPTVPPSRKTDLDPTVPPSRATDLDPTVPPPRKTDLKLTSDDLKLTSELHRMTLAERLAHTLGLDPRIVAVATTAAGMAVIAESLPALALRFGLRVCVVCSLMQNNLPEETPGLAPRPKVG